MEMGIHLRVSTLLGVSALLRVGPLLGVASLLGVAPLLGVASLLGVAPVPLLRVSALLWVASPVSTSLRVSYRTREDLCSISSPEQSRLGSETQALPK